MEDNFRNDDFEQYVRGQADQHRMFPSEKVWGAIDNALHPRKKWYGFGLAFLLLLTGGAVTWVMSTYPVSKQKDIAASRPDSGLQSTELTQPEGADLKEILQFEGTGSRSLRKKYSPPVPGPEVGLSAQESLVITGTIEGPVSPGEVINTTPRPAPLTIVHSAFRQAGTEPAEQRAEPSAVATVQPLVAQELPAKKEAVAVAAETNLPPLSIESVINSFKPKPKKLSWQVFVTPTISYRNLSENKAFSRSMADPLSPGAATYPFASMTDVNNAVTHKPDLGLQAGFSARYPISRGVKLIGGFQFNINRYDIKAFRNTGEVARIELNGSNTAVVAWSSYRSQSGNKLDWLKNIYFSVSAPLGAELALFENRKKSTSLRIAGTVQPTVVLRNKTYLISTDYKNYAQVPWLTRKVNLNTSFETFVVHNKGKMQWQVGPQVRYQLLSSFNRRYPIRENLFDFGVKFGITLNK